jgi:hypothetical protein
MAHFNQVKDGSCCDAPCEKDSACGDCGYFYPASLGGTPTNISLSLIKGSRSWAYNRSLHSSNEYYEGYRDPSSHLTIHQGRVYFPELQTRESDPNFGKYRLRATTYYAMPWDQSSWNDIKYPSYWSVAPTDYLTSISFGLRVEINGSDRWGLEYFDDPADSANSIQRGLVYYITFRDDTCEFILPIDINTGHARSITDNRTNPPVMHPGGNPLYDDRAQFFPENGRVFGDWTFEDNSISVSIPRYEEDEEAENPCSGWSFRQLGKIKVSYGISVSLSNLETPEWEEEQEEFREDKLLRFWVIAMVKKTHEEDFFGEFIASTGSNLYAQDLEYNQFTWAWIPPEDHFYQAFQMSFNQDKFMSASGDYEFDLEYRPTRDGLHEFHIIVCERSNIDITYAVEKYALDLSLNTTTTIPPG